MNKLYNFLYNSLRLANAENGVNDAELRLQASYAIEELALGAGTPAPADAAAALCSGYTPFGDSPEEGLVQAIKNARVAGILPYYCTKALAAYLAITIKLPQYAGSKMNLLVATHGVRAAIQEMGFTFETQLTQQVAEAFPKMLAGDLAENHKAIALIKDAYAKGYYYEKVYRGCAQCTLAAMFDITGKSSDTLFKATNSFAAGMGMFGDGACGGYAGGLLLLGMYAGRRREFFDGDKEEKDKIALLSHKLHQRFLDTYGTVICQDIHKDIFGRAFHIRGAQDKEDFEIAGAHTGDKCTAVVAQAAAWCTEILLEEGLLTA